MKDIRQKLLATFQIEHRDHVEQIRSLLAMIGKTAVEPAGAELENLLGNAWKFTTPVAEAVIEFGVSQRDGVPTYFVRDNGAGFNMTYAGKLFTPFQRVHTEAQFPGTGIGLATVHRIVDRHGGRVWAEGAVDRGATFFWILPTLRPGRLT